MLRSVHCGHSFQRGWRQIWCSLWFNFLKTTTRARLSLGNINNRVIRDMQIHTDAEEGSWGAKEVPSPYCSLEVGFFIDPVSDSWSEGASSFFLPLLTHAASQDDNGVRGSLFTSLSGNFSAIIPAISSPVPMRETIYTVYQVSNRVVGIESILSLIGWGNVHVTSKATVHSTGVISSPTATPHNGQGKEESAKLLAWNNAV